MCFSWSRHSKYHKSIMPPPSFSVIFLMMSNFSRGQLFLASIFYQLTSEKNEVRTIQQFLISCTIPVYSDSTLSRCCCITASSRKGEGGRPNTTFVNLSTSSSSVDLSLIQWNLSASRSASLTRVCRKAFAYLSLVQPPLQRSWSRSGRTSTQVPVEHTRGHPDRQIHLPTTGQSAD